MSYYDSYSNDFFILLQEIKNQIWAVIYWFFYRKLPITLLQEKGIPDHAVIQLGYILQDLEKVVFSSNEFTARI